VKQVVVVLALLLAPLAAACGSGDQHYCTGTKKSGGCRVVPSDATKQEFCAAGEAFSESEGFSNGVKAAEHLASVGTPPDIKASARAGFIELVERMADSENGPDFRRRTRSLTSRESKHLLDLDTYIQGAC
jgi:hypothetical protein